MSGYIILDGVGSGFLVINRFGAGCGWYPTRYKARKAIKALIKEWP